MQIKVFKCSNCGRLYIQRKLMCYCGGRSFYEVEIPKEGIIMSYTKVYVSPATLKGEKPYYLVIVKLTDGLCVSGRIITNNKDVKINSKVKLLKVENDCFWFTLL